MVAQLRDMARIDDEIKTSFADDKQRFMPNLIYTSNCFQNLFVDLLKPYGISPQQFNVLRILRGAGAEVTMNSIKELMVDKSPNLTRLSDKLMDKGLIERRRSANDRRVVYLTISEPGLKLLQRIDDDGIFMKLDYIKLITEEEAKLINDVLDKIRP